MAETGGWRTSPAPGPLGYPQYWVEIATGRGTQYRWVTLRNSNEEKIFTDNVNLSEWTQANYPNPALDGIPTNLSDLAEERRQQLHRELDQEFEEPGSARG